MNQRRRRSSASRPAVSLDPLYRGGDEPVRRPEKELVELADSEVKLQSAKKKVWIDPLGLIQQFLGTLWLGFLFLPRYC